MDDFQLDARKWKFLDNHTTYSSSPEGVAAGIKPEPLERQFATTKEILQRFKGGQGVLLADDVGLGKTTVGILIAWIVACQGKRVRIYAPNDVLRRRWAEELERHVPMLAQIGASSHLIKQGKVKRLHAGRVQVTTHHALVDSSGEQRTACDLMIIDEAHRAKGESSGFNKALGKLGDSAKRKLILTATPFSIQIAELEQLLGFVGARELVAVKKYAEEMKQLYTAGDGGDVVTKSKSLVCAAKAAIKELQPYLIRHGIDDLSRSERKHFGSVGSTPWNIDTPPASEDDIQFLLRMDRLLQLASERKGERRSDPRFYIGWQQLGTALKDADTRCQGGDNPIALRHVESSKKAFDMRVSTPHPKITAVSETIQSLIDAGEKVLVFCHHRASATELLTALERLKAGSGPHNRPPETSVWRMAWKTVSQQWTNLGLCDEDINFDEKNRDSSLLRPLINWLCSPGICRQVGGWLVEPAQNVEALARQLSSTRPRKAGSGVPTIAEAAQALAKTLLDPQSTSTLALLKSIAKGESAFGGKNSHFPGRLDEGLSVMGSWDHDGHGEPPSTLYKGKSDIVIALFNSPFGPDVLVATDRLSEGVDLHRCCRHLIHYELDPSPVRTLQRNGRIRRVGSWAALTKQPICYAYPTFGGTRDERAVNVMRQRIDAFGLLLGGVPSLDDTSDREQDFAERVLHRARMDLEKINRNLAVKLGGDVKQPISFTVQQGC